jgi:hypothetical protein
MTRTLHTETAFAAPSANLKAAGYTPGRPANGMDADADWAVCQQLRCTCGNHGLAYQPFVRPRPPQRRGVDYRILAVCPNCGRCQEL